MNPLGSRISRLEDSFSFGARNSFYRVQEIGSQFHYPNFENDYRKDLSSISYTRASGATYRGRTGKVRGVAISTSTVGYGTGSKTWTVAAGAGVDMEFAVGENITATGETQELTLLGTVTSYNPTTQQLVCNITSYPAGAGGLTDSVWKLIRTANPRIECDSAGTPLGILIEPASTNNADPDVRTSFIGSGTTATLSLTTDTPLGATESYWIRDVTVSATTATHTVRYLARTYYSGTRTMTTSAFVKKGTAKYIGLNCTVSSTHAASCIFDIETGTTGQTHTFGSSVIGVTKVESWGNDWYRIIMQVTFTFAAMATVICRIFTAPAKTGNTFVTSNGLISYLGAGETFKATLLQHEDAGFETSVIVGSTWSIGLTRNPDTVRYEGTKFTDWFFANGTGLGTFVVDFIPSQQIAGYVATTDFEGTYGDGAVGIYESAGEFRVVDGAFDESLPGYATGNGVQSMGFTTLNSTTVTTVKYAVNGQMTDPAVQLYSDISNATVFSLGSIYDPGGGLYGDYNKIIIQSVKWFDTILSDYELRYYTGMRG